MYSLPQFNTFLLFYLFNQVHKYFGVCIGLKEITPIGKLRLYGFIVLYDPVVDYHKVTGIGVVRVGVYIIRNPVGCPTGVSDSQRTIERYFVFRYSLQVRNLTFCFGHVDLVPVVQGDPCTVVSPVLQAL